MFTPEQTTELFTAAVAAVAAERDNVGGDDDCVLAVLKVYGPEMDRLLAEVEAQREQARRWAVALEQQLAEIKRIAYIGGQSADIVRRWIIGVFEDDRRELNGGEDR